MSYPHAALPTKFCPSCGAIIDGRAAVCPTCSTAQPVLAYGGAYMQSEKRILPAVILCMVLGPFGGHRFYAGKWKTAILQLCTLGGLGLWVIYDLVMLVIGSFTDSEGNRITEWT